MQDLARRVVGVALLAFFFGQIPAGFATQKGVHLVSIKDLDPTIVLDIRYATKDNFMKEVLYSQARALARKPVALKLLQAQKKLRQQGYGLKLFDAYRPLAVQKRMWEKFPLEGYVANPAKGSNHNRGAAFDVTLVDLEGNELEMPSNYDEFSERAHRDFQGASPKALKHRRILQEAMESCGFVGIRTEWWHFDDVRAKKYQVLDLPFSEIILP